MQLLLTLLFSYSYAFQTPFLAPEASFALEHSIHVSLRHPARPPLHRRHSTQENIQISSQTGYALTRAPLKRITTTAKRPNNQAAFQAARRHSYTIKKKQRALTNLNLSPVLTVQEERDRVLASNLEWEDVEIEMPDISDSNTLATLAKITGNAYHSGPDDSGWYDLEGKWNLTNDFGWKEDGIRGHVFIDDTNSTVVVAIKGTSAGLVGGGGETSKNDKTNDNLLFSCCCAKVDWTWTPVCDCNTGSNKCDQDCLEDAVMVESAYYPIATNLFNNITALYPDKQIWLTGHSLGGSLAALLSLTYGIPAVTYESVSDRLPAQRLHLPMPPAYDYTSSNITVHVFNNADPVPMGVCTGVTSTCALAGFALETKCHTGKTIIYDTIGVLGWSVDIRNHRIATVIELLTDHWRDSGLKLATNTKTKTRGWGPWWPGKGKDGDPDDTPNKDDPKTPSGVPPATVDKDCKDCFRWKFE